MTGHTRNLLGMGIYTRAEAARLLGLSPGRVTSWVRGYRYAWDPKGRRRRGEQPPVVKTDIPSIGGSVAVSFLELVELFVVKRFRDKGIPLQTVRVAWNHAARAFDTEHPFANRRVFMDEGRIFVALRDDEMWPDVLEVSDRRMPFQIAAGPIFRHSFEELEFDEETELALRWWPAGRNTPVVLDPRIAFGAPVVPRTRVPTAIIARFAQTRAIAAVADAFELAPEQVKAAVSFETRLVLAA